MSQTPPGGSGNEKRWPLAAEIIGAGAGLVVYAYAAGGLIEYLHLAGAELPATQAVSMLSNQQILVVGSVILVMTLPIALATRLAASAWGKLQRKVEEEKESLPPITRRGRARRQAGRKSRRGPRHTAADTAAAGAALSVLTSLIFLASTLVVPPRVGLNGEVAVQVLAAAASLGSIAGLVVRFTLAIRRNPLFRLRDLSRLPRSLVAVLVLSLALVGGSSLAYFTPLQLPSATVMLQGGTCLSGPYLSRDAADVNLIDGESHSLYTVPSDEVKALQINAVGGVAGHAIDRVTCPAAFPVAARSGSDGTRTRDLRRDSRSPRL
jgi:hypothetical protein